MPVRSSRILHNCLRLDNILESKEESTLGSSDFDSAYCPTSILDRKLRAMAITLTGHCTTNTRILGALVADGIVVGGSRAGY
jgi:hypothetical protein